MRIAALIHRGDCDRGIAAQRREQGLDIGAVQRFLQVHDVHARRELARMAHGQSRTLGQGRDIGCRGLCLPEREAFGMDPRVNGLHCGVGGVGTKTHDHSTGFGADLDRVGAYRIPLWGRP